MIVVFDKPFSHFSSKFLDFVWVFIDHDGGVTIRRLLKKVNLLENYLFRIILKK